MTTPPEPEETGSDVDIDLLADDALLREAIREPTSIRLPTKAVIEVPHIADWPHEASLWASRGLYDAWATAVLSPKDAAAFAKAELHNYQVERIVSAVSAAGGVSPGKPSRSSASRRSTKRR